MSADPAYQAWRGQKLVEAETQPPSKHDGDFMINRINNIGTSILNLARPVRQPDFAALGLGSADEAAGRN